MTSTSTLARGLAAVLLITAAGCANAPRIATPECARPAPLLGQYDGRAPGYQVHMREPSADAARAFVQRHQLKPRDVSSNGEWIALRNVSPALVAQLRCEPGVESIQFDAYLGRLAP